jgi:hypothetical protein
MTSDCVTRKRDSSKQRSFGHLSTGMDMEDFSLHTTVINNPYNDEYSAGSPERLISLQSLMHGEVVRSKMIASTRRFDHHFLRLSER